MYKFLRKILSKLFVYPEHLVVQAYEFAENTITEKRNNGTLEFHHVEWTANCMKDSGAPGWVIVAMLFHDCIEEGRNTFGGIHAKYGFRPACMVLLLTKPRWLMKMGVSKRRILKIHLGIIRFAAERISPWIGSGKMGDRLYNVIPSQRNPKWTDANYRHYTITPRWMIRYMPSACEQIRERLRHAVKAAHDSMEYSCGPGKAC